MNGRRGTSAGDLLGILRGGPRTRTELAMLTAQTRATVSQRLDALELIGLVGLAANQASTGGRPSATYEFRAGAGVILAVDLGVQHATVAVADLAGQPLATKSYPIRISDGPQRIIPFVAERLDALLADLTWSGPIAGVGVGIPGPVEHSTGRPTSPPIMPGWDRYDIMGTLRQHYRAPVLVDNDANILALGERRLFYPDFGDLIVVKVGSGVGAGIICGGNLVRGTLGAAGDLGHVYSPQADGLRCRCGNIGCVEAVAGGIGIADSLGLGPGAVASDVADLARAGDLRAIGALRRAGHALGEVLATCIALLNPRAVVLAGDLATVGESLIAGVRQAVFARSLPLASRDLQVVLARSGELGGVIGATQLMLDAVLAPDYVDQLVAASQESGT